MPRHFTKQQIDEIRSQLATYGVRDSELPETLNVTDEDFIAIVQEQTNKRLSIETLGEHIRLTFVNDHNTAVADHETAVEDHNQAGRDHTASESATERANAAAASAEHMVDIHEGPQGPQGNTGSSVDYPYELVNNLTTDDATKGLSAAQGKVLDGKISQLGQKTTGSIADKITSENTGKYIGYQGTLASGASFAYSSQFYAEAGSTITITGRGYLNYVSMIAKVVVEGSSYTPLVMSIDSDVHKYEYKVTESGYYACSWGTAKPHEIYVYKNTPEILAERIEALEVFDVNIGDRLDSITESALTIETKETGKYISVNGSPASSANFSYSKPVFIKGGTLIIVNAQGYLTYVAIIAKVVVDGEKYIMVTSSIDSTLRQYSYLVPEDGFYAFSWHTAEGITAKIVSYPVLDGYRIQENLYCGVPSVGIIGDSLASGAGYDPNTNGVHDNIQYAWWKVFERKSGMTYRRFCEGGMSTRSFITNATYGLPAALTEGNQCKLYIIGLEINDRAIGASYLGQESDIDMSDPDNNADTYYGNYAKIIQKITAFNAGCKFILFTNPRTDGDFNDAIRVISRKFQNCYLVDLWALYSKHFISGGFYSKYQDQSAHYPVMAYQSMANLLARAIDDCINDNSDDFVNIQY